MTLERRLSRMEQQRPEADYDIATMLEAARRAGIERLQAIGGDAYQAEQVEEDRAKLAWWEAEATARRLSQMEQLIMDGMRRVVASYDQEIAQ